MATTARLLTYDDYFVMPDDGKRYELIDGELLEMPAPSRRHQWVLGELYVALHAHARNHGLGEVYVAPLDIRLSPHDVVQPDLVFVSKERLDLFDPNALVGAPDLVVEILSPSTRSRDLGVKLRLYAGAGVGEVWFVDLDVPDIRVLTLGDGGAYMLVHPNEGSVESLVLPGFRVDVAVLFAGLPAAT